MSIKEKAKEFKMKSRKWYKEHEKRVIFGSALVAGVCGTVALSKIGDKLYEENMVKHVVKATLQKAENGNVGLYLSRNDKFGKIYDDYTIYWDADSAKSVGEKIIAYATTPFDMIKTLDVDSIN